MQHTHFLLPTRNTSVRRNSSRSEIRDSKEGGAQSVQVSERRVSLPTCSYFFPLRMDSTKQIHHAVPERGGAVQWCSEYVLGWQCQWYLRTQLPPPPPPPPVACHFCPHITICFSGSRSTTPPIPKRAQKRLLNRSKDSDTDTDTDTDTHRHSQTHAHKCAHAHTHTHTHTHLLNHDKPSDTHALSLTRKARAHTHFHTYTLTLAHTHFHTYTLTLLLNRGKSPDTHAPSHTHTHARARVHTHTHIHTYTHLLNHSNSSDTGAPTHANTHAHTHTGTHRDTHRHTHREPSDTTARTCGSSPALVCYGVATISMLLKMIGLFCRISSLL